MGIYIKNWSLADWKELLKWAKVGANNAMIGEFAEVEEIPPHGDLVDKQRMAETNEQHYKIFEGEQEADYARKVVLRMLDQAPTVIPADKEEKTE